MDGLFQIDGTGATETLRKVQSLCYAPNDDFVPHPWGTVGRSTRTPALSGLAAAVRSDGEAINPGVFASMLEAVAYRGGDYAGSWSGEGAALGAALRWVTSEAQGESQPLVDPSSGVSIIFDGYLCNWDDLRRDLASAGCRIRSQTDTELVLHAYLRWGQDFASHLDGEFALVLWDTTRRVLHAARDPVGARPLVYWFDGRTLLVASEARAILAALPSPPPPNMAYLAQVVTDLAYCAEDTPWEGIRRLPPANLLTLAGGRVQETRYWEPDLEARIDYRRDEEYEEHYRGILADSVRRSSRAHAPASFHVSGGLDSTSLFCMAHHLIETSGLPTPDIAGHTLAGPAGSPADEIAYVEAVERLTGRTIERHPLFMPQIDHFFAEAQRFADIPPYPNGVMSDRLTESAVASGSRVHISGLGGDNWLDGQPIYYGEELAGLRFGNVARILREDFALIGRAATADRFARTAVLRLLPERFHRAAREVLGRKQADDLASLQWLTPKAIDLLRDRHNARVRLLNTYPYRVRYKFAKLTSPEMQIALRETERMAANGGAESRSPMFSRAFIDFSNATPERLRQRGNMRKRLHRQALRGLVPDQVLHRTDKAAFCLTFRQLFPGLPNLIGTLPEGPLRLLVRDPTYLANLASEASRLDGVPIYPVWSALAATVLAEVTSVRR